VANFTPVFHPIYRIGLPLEGTISEVFNTDRREFGGSDQYNALAIATREGGFNSFPYYADICVPPLSCCYFAYAKTQVVADAENPAAEESRYLQDEKPKEGAKAS
jgi:1,4-alpha-glucan branching enzyme